MSKGYSLHIGLNRVSSIHYKGWNGQLQACKADAVAMLNIAIAQNFTKVICLLNENASKANFIYEMEWLINNLVSNDLLFISFSGHGGQTLDQNNEEEDKKDEYWCLYDGILMDDIIYRFFSRFKKDIRIILISDSCHSGSIFKSQNIFNKSLLKKQLPPKSLIRATIQSISSCADPEIAAEVAGHGRFTKALLNVWDEGRFKGNYEDFFASIKNKMPYGQTPQHNFLGANVSRFKVALPFTI